MSLAPQADSPSQLERAADRGGAAAPSPAPGGVFALPARWSDHLTLESPDLTRLYWAGVALVVAGLFVTRLLPCVDYPQHLALSDIARRLQDPNAPEQASYQLNYFTYNGLFHIVVARLAAFLPIELAGRLVVATSLVATAGAVVALVRVLHRPPLHAALFTPILFSFSLGWGFVNYVLATAVAMWTLVFVARAVIRPSPLAYVPVGALGLVCAFSHVLAMLILCVAAAALAFEVAWRVVPPKGRVAGRLVRAVLWGGLAVLPLLIGCVYCIKVYQEQYLWDPKMYRDPTIEGTAPSLWEKVTFFSAFATDLFGDGTDQLLLWITVCVMGYAARLAWFPSSEAPGAGPRASASGSGSGSGSASAPAPREPTPPIVAPFVVLTIVYFATPMVLIGTHLIFPRIAQWAVLGGVLAMPRFPDAMLMRARTWIPRLAIAAGLNTVMHCALFEWETSDASATIDDMPQGGAATAVIWEPWTMAFRNGTLTHLAAYYAARKHGSWAFAFARYLSVPVRFKAGRQPAWPAQGWEFNGEDYNPRCKYARAFPLVIIKAPEDLPTDTTGEPLVRRLVFKQDAAEVRLLSHHGRYWAFDSAGLPDDGTF